MAFLNNKFHLNMLEDGENFEVIKEMRYECKRLNRIFIIPIGFITDLSSIPWCFWTLLRRSPARGTHRIPALIHDWLCYSKIVSRKEADKIYKEALKEYKEKKIIIKAMSTAVRGYSKFQKIKTIINL